MSTAEHTRSSYKKHRVKRLAADKQNRQLNAQYILEYKLAHKCVFCFEAEPACLDFHHKDPTAKDFTIGCNIQHRWAKIKPEIEKCLVLCSNCHRKVHAGLITILSE